MTITQQPGADYAVPGQAPTKRRTNWVGVVAAFAAGVALPVLLAGGLAVTAALTPCAVEDGTGDFACHWDASERGNGQGYDFVALFHGRFTIFTNEG